MDIPFLPSSECNEDPVLRPRDEPNDLATGVAPKI